ncbi:Flagellar biosynthetic protein FliQ [Polystyrenella longa]|uniref:Flagellar biosynthetic protein FliQ n=1 Tax=Polystyrenella longa TaxID=2528007 RepID=A0A518CIR7_9PLAN|nr:flagellar biosynthesis protein FliQ [Polystyrenella longa]QDU79129.1 Flagellar biosynthetic protein FliQ [Polystyrenella longa]
MNVDQSIELAREAVILTLVLSTPVMVVAVVVGLLISILQAVTQLQDQTLSFVPKVIAMFLATLYILPWSIQQAMEYSITLFTEIPGNL